MVISPIITSPETIESLTINTEPTVGIFGICPSVFGIFWCSNYRHIGIGILQSLAVGTNSH